MTIVAELHDGRRLEFPDGTDPAVVQKTVRNILGVTDAPPVPHDQPQQPTAYERGRHAGPIKKTLTTALQGPFFNFADEILGGVAAIGETPRALIDRATGKSSSITDQIGGAYRNMRDDIRGAHDQYKDDNQWLALGIEIAAGMPMGGPIAGALRGAVAAKNVGRVREIINAMKVSGAASAMQAAGEAKTLEEMPADAAYGGLFGMGVGGGLNVAGRTGSAIWGMARPQNALRVPSNAAERRVLEAFLRDDVTPEMAAARVARRGGPEARVVDLGGENVRQMLDTVATLPGKTRNLTERMIRSRQAGRADRLESLIEPLNPSGQRAYEANKALDAMKKAASPLYDAVENVKIKDDALIFKRLYGTQSFDEILNDAQRYAADDLNRGPWSGNLPNTLRDWDDVKRVIDDRIANSRDQFGKATNKTRLFVQMKEALVSELDKQTKGAYATARNAYAGPAAMQDALEQGRDVFKRSLEVGEIKDITAGLTKSELEAFRIGASESLRAQTGTPRGQAALLNAWKDKNLRERLRAIYGSERDYRKAMSRLLSEENLRKGERLGGSRGSQTQPRDAGIDDLNASILRESINAGSGSPNPAGLMALAGNMVKRFSVPESVRDEIGRILLTQGPEAQSKMRSFVELSRQMQDEPARRAAYYGLGGGLLSGGLY